MLTPTLPLVIDNVPVKVKYDWNTCSVKSNLNMDIYSAAKKEFEWSPAQVWKHHNNKWYIKFSPTSCPWIDKQVYLAHWGTLKTYTFEVIFDCDGFCFKICN